ncbi:Acetyltransferase (GNAT) family protein [Vibrio quintilis]|uniref:Acetyltransferase (GNAT) family protein n=2 Tax=Vibrio quintilis TaxID=1117707 RepID=A0A1M7YXQ7_9VIBR|nr:Acetyltransferase (GNAT) family protein [Vibrio quintilis]
MNIREMNELDFRRFWPVFEEIIKAQETYAFDPDMSYLQGYAVWCETPVKTYICEESGQVLGSYYIKPNAMGPGKHICNCGFMVAPKARGKGVARAMCQHAQLKAVKMGFRAMQFNSVVSTNEVAVRLWQKEGFSIIGTVPEAYRHRTLGYVDSLIMHKKLAESDKLPELA